MTMTIAFKAENAAKIAAKLERHAASQTVGSQNWCALGGLASAIWASEDGTVKIDRHDARLAQPGVKEVFAESVRDGHGDEPWSDDLSKVVMQIQDQFKILFTIWNSGERKTLTVGSGKSHHRVFTEVALDLNGLGALWAAPQGAEATIDLSEAIPRARSQRTQTLIASMGDEVKDDLEAVRAALAELSESDCATISLI